MYRRPPSSCPSTPDNPTLRRAVYAVLVILVLLGVAATARYVAQVSEKGRLEAEARQYRQQEEARRVREKGRGDKPVTFTGQ